MAEINIPFLNILEFMALDQTEDYGNLSVVALSAVPSVAALASPTFELYCHLDDLELVGVEPAATTLVTVNSGRLVKMEKEVEEDARPLSSAAAAQSRALRFIARGVPMLSSVANSAAWFVDGLGGALKAWGWSKPAVLDPVTRVARFCNVAEFNVDAPSATQVLAPMSNNHLVVSPSFAGTDVDEMALAYVLGCYSQINQPNFGTALIHGNVIWGMKVSPSNMWFRIPAAGFPYGNINPPATIDVTNNSFQPSHQFFWAQMFRQWRGGFRFRFTFVKTKMHGGRVLVAYNPTLNYNIDTPVAGTNSVAGPETNAGLIQPFGYTKIFDLRDGNLLEFDVPYTSSFPYLPFGSSMGDITMTVLDPLQAPNMVAQSVNIVVEVSCLPGFELAIPCGLQYPPHPLGTPLAQSGRMVATTPDHTIGDRAAETCVGEKINSVKQLIMLPGVSGFSLPLTAVDYSYTALPWFQFQNPSSTSPLPTNTSFFSQLWYGPAAGTCYLYAKGSTDYHVYHFGHARTELRARWRRGNAGNPSPAVLTQAATFKACSTTPYAPQALDSYTHVRFPAYQATERVYTSLFATTVFDGKLGGTNVNPTLTQASYLAIGQIMFNNSSGVPIFGQILRSAGDDAALGHYMGPTPLAVVQSTNTAAVDGNLAE